MKGGGGGGRSRETWTGYIASGWLAELPTLETLSTSRGSC